jgi:hypothetical protein
MTKAIQTIHHSGALTRRENVPGQPKQRSFHAAGVLGRPNDAWLATWSRSIHPHNRHFPLPDAAKSRNDRSSALPARRDGETTVAQGFRTRFSGKKSIFQASSIAAKWLAGLKSGWQAAGRRLPFLKLQSHELFTPHDRRLRTRHSAGHPDSPQNNPLTF